MITYRRSQERGHANRGWLDSFHTFSFADYYDPAHMGFRSLRVLNEDRVAPGRGFGAHGHRDMEIISYVIAGKLGHKDSMGHEEVLGANEIQVMSAGTGVVHSEFNASQTEPVHFLQIWIEPAQRGLTSSYQQLAFAAESKLGGWKLLASPTGGEGVARLHQDASVAVTELAAGETRPYALAPGRHAWLHVVKGAVLLNGEPLNAGDAAAISDQAEIGLTGSGDASSEVLLFDLA
jgi:redox-sensitive bicupin YhaK (pirin superfamily)